MSAPGNYPAIHTGGLAVIPIEHQTLLSAGLREKERGSVSGSGSGPYPAWAYRGTIQITNPVAVANYQHYLSLSWKPGMKFDFSDIRFTQQDGTICPYWIETYTSKTSATVWIKIPSASQRQITLWYGNSRAASESSGTNTFDFFDDFPGSSLDAGKWDSSGSPTVSGGICTIGGTADETISSKTSWGKGYAIRSRFRFDAENAQYGYIGFIQKSPGRYASMETGSGGNKARAYTSNGTIESTQADYTPDYHVWDIIRNSTAAIYKKNAAAFATHSTYEPTESLPAMVYAYTNTAEISIDWILVRKYADIEPTLALKQYGPRPDQIIIYYPFLPSPLGELPGGDFIDEMIEFTQTMTGETPVVSLGHPVSFTQTMVGSTPITDYYEAAISPTQTARVKVFAKLFLNLSLVRTKKITISKSIQDSLWRADIDLHQYKNLDMAVLRHCTYTTTDHLGSSHTLFTGILPGAQPQLSPADETTRITGYDYGWYLTQRKVPEAYLHNTAATNPTAVIRGLLGGDDWMTETGIEPYSIQTVSEWGTTLNRRVFDFDRSTSRLQAIQRICDYTRYVFIVKWRDIGGGILNPCAYFCHEDDIDTYLDLPAEVTFTKPDPYVEEKIIWDVKGDERFNRVTVYGRKSDGTSISYTAETADVTNGDEIPVEFVESSGAFTTEAQVQARAEELLTYFSTTQKTYTVTLNLRTDLELLQKVKFVGWSEIPEDTMRIIAISYAVDDATATKKVQIQVTSETKLSQIRRMYRGMNPDPLSEVDALFDAKAASMPGNDVGIITAISEDGTEATVELEDGRTVTARIV